MPSTRDRAKVGKTEYVIQVWLDDGHDSYAKSLDSAERPTKGLAVATANRLMTNHFRHPGGEVWCQIIKGTWVAEDFDDDTYGHIQDATWEKDDDFYHCRYLHDDTSITFDEED